MLSRQLARPIAQLVAAAVAGIAAAVLLIWMAWLVSPSIASQGLELEASRLELVQGSGQRTPSGIRIRGPGPQGVAIVQAAIKPFDAADYATLSWQVDGLAAGQSLRLIWGAREERGSLHARDVTSSELQRGRLMLAESPEWKGTVIAIGLVVLGPLPRPMTVQTLSLTPAPPGLREIVTRAARAWTQDEGWTGRSINFEADGPGVVPRTLQVAIWTAVTLFIYLMLDRRRPAPRSSAPYLIILLGGWLLLDLAWQASLWGRLDATHSQYASLHSADRPGAGPDRTFYPFVQAIKDAIGDQRARLLILTSDPMGYAAGRARYHLFPINSLALKRIETADVLRPGDFVLLMAPAERGILDPRRQLLSVGDTEVPVDTVIRRSGLGSLVRVQSGRR